MYQLLRTGNWRIGSGCTKLIKCLPSLVRDETKVEDVAKMDGDDPADAARYGLKSRHSPGRKPYDLRVQEKLEARIGMTVEEAKPEQYTHVMMQRFIVEQQEKRMDKPFKLISRSRRRR